MRVYDSIKPKNSFSQKFTFTSLFLRNSGIHFNYYKELRNFTNATVQREKRAYIDHVFNHKEPRVLWSSLRSLNVCSNRSPTVPECIGDVDAINNYFVTSQNCTSGDSELIDHYNNNIFDDSIDLFNFSFASESEVASAMRSIRSGAVGGDGIGMRMLDICCPNIIPYICHIINVIIETSTYPSVWKTAIVRPIPKVRNPSRISDLRPISILPVMSKIFEKIVASRLREHLRRHDILPESQSGFRPGYSCTSALLHVTDDILRAADDGKITALVLLDFSKAFDTLHHGTLLSILHFIGLSDHAVKLIKDYLEARDQVVVLNGVKSNSNVVVSGVPQGSILGPLMYLIYTIDLCRTLRHCRSHMYADDTQIYYSFPISSFVDAQAYINSDLAILIKFAKRLCLTINSTKSSVLVFGSRVTARAVRESIDIRIEGAAIRVVDGARNLGVAFDSSLRFRGHVGFLLRKAYSTLKMLYCSRHMLNQKLKIQLCDSLVLSTFNYCDQLYGPCLDGVERARIQRAQNACLRFIYGIRRGSRISHTLKWAGWLSMAQRRLLHSACLYHSVICNKTPAYLYNKIRFRTDVHNINVRHKNTITIPKHKLQMFKRSFSYCVPDVYNEFVTLQNHSLSRFKLEVRKRLFSAS